MSMCKARKKKEALGMLNLDACLCIPIQQLEEDAIGMLENLQEEMSKTQAILDKKEINKKKISNTNAKHR